MAAIMAACIAALRGAVCRSSGQTDRQYMYTQLVLGVDAGQFDHLGCLKRRGAAVLTATVGFTMAPHIERREKNKTSIDTSLHLAKETQLPTQFAICGVHNFGKAKKKSKKGKYRDRQAPIQTHTKRRKLTRQTMNENSPTLSLDPLHSPGSDTSEQQLPVAQSSLGQLTLSAQDTRQNQTALDAVDSMAKTKRRMFSTPLLRRSATASSAAAASAASRIKNNLSTVTKLQTALKRNSASSAEEETKANVDRAPTVPSLSRSSTESSVKKEETKTTSNHGRKFGIPSLMRIRTSPKDKTHSNTTSDGPVGSPEAKSQCNNSETEANNNDEVHESTPQHQMSAINTASRFVMGMPTLLRRAVSNNHTPPSADAATATQKKSPDTSANSTPRGEFPEDDLEENDRHSLLMMLQVPEARNSHIPLMAASEAW